MNSIIKDVEEKNVLKKTEYILKRRLGGIGVAVVSIAYLFWGYFKLYQQELSILEIIVTGAITVFVAYLIDSLLRWQGIIDGSVERSVLQAQDSHNAKVVEAQPYFEYSEGWSEEENRRARKMARTYILTQKGLRYSDFFEDDGEFKSDCKNLLKYEKGAPRYIKHRYKEQIKALNKAIKFKITPVTLTKITSELNVNLDPNYLGRTRDEYTRQKGRMAGLTKVASFGVLSLVGFRVIQDPSIASFYYGLIQISIFLLFGFISYYLSYTYVTGEYVQGLRKKSLLLDSLIAYGKHKKERDERGNES
jgi:hypothetical protein